MPLHLLKLCVGAESISDLEDWIAERQAQRRARGEPAEQLHTTRMVPKKIEEILDGGSLYWVIKGQVQARQKIIDIRPFTGNDGITRCNLILGPEVVETALQPRRAFQGWRYLKPEEAPADLAALGGGNDLPPELKRELAELGLL